MATMATSHSLSVMANSCIKQPINPKTGISSTMHERPSTSTNYLYGEFNTGNDIERDFPLENGGSDLASSKPALQTIATNLRNCTDEEFYEKLTQLKNEHKKTLVLCEKLYKEKMGQNDIDMPSRRPVTLTNTLNGESNAGSIVGRSIDMHLNDHRHENFEKSKDAKPPLPISKTQRISRSPSDIPACRPSSAPTHRRGSLTRSLEEEVWKSITERREKEAMQDMENYESLDDLSPDDSGAMSKIEDMWEEFSIEDYYPRTRVRPSSASVTKREKEKEWRHRITIPKPFKMTIREENKEEKVSKAQIELEEKRRQNEMEEQMECSKKFKAAPVPAHVYLPLFDEIMEQQEAKRRYIRHNSQELLKSQEKPFKFHYRERSRERHERRNSAPQQRESKTKNIFKANPVPDYLYDNSVYDKILEEEEYRKIRMKMRAEDLLKTSSLPPNMAAMEKAKELKAKEKTIKKKKKRYPRTKVNHEVPDYDDLYIQFQKELARRKNERDGTTVKPFNLHTNNFRSSREKIMADIENDEKTLKENRWPYQSSRATPRRNLAMSGQLSTSMDSIPAKMTNAASLRTSQTKKKLSTMTEQERKELDEERRKRNREMKYRRLINERAASDNLSETTEQRLRRYKEAERERMEQYEKELQEIRDRVDQRPMLFEQESQVNAKKSVEKKFSQKLRSYGVDEDALQTRSSRTASVRDDYDSYDDDFDDTYIKKSEIEVES